MPKDRGDVEKLTALEYLILYKVATMDAEYEDIARSVYLSREGLKYHLRMIRLHLDGVRGVAASVHRAHLYGYMDRFRRCGPDVPRPDLNPYELHVLWNFGVHGGVAAMDRAGVAPEVRLRNAMSAVHRKFQVRRTCVIIHRAFLMGLFDKHLERIPMSERSRRPSGARN